MTTEYVQVQEPVPCPHCGGTGLASSVVTGRKSCAMCGGTGISYYLMTWKEKPVEFRFTFDNRTEELP